MPFVTTHGSLKVNWDITYDKYDPKTGLLVEPGNKLKPLNLTNVDHFDFNPDGDQAQELLWRGQPNPIEMNFRSDTAVFRILTNRFESGFEKDEPESDWGRFMRDYRREAYQMRAGASRIIFYEPNIKDVRVDVDTKFHFPLWVLEELTKQKEFDNALKIAKVNMPGQPMLRQNEYETIMQEIESRREKEKKVTVGNVSRSTKQSES
jgi:hypothetical protein